MKTKVNVKNIIIMLATKFIHVKVHHMIFILVTTLISISHLLSVTWHVRYTVLRSINSHNPMIFNRFVCVVGVCVWVCVICNVLLRFLFFSFTSFLKISRNPISIETTSKFSFVSCELVCLCQCVCLCVRLILRRRPCPSR